jgi:hypothetical protein
MNYAAICDIFMQIWRLDRCSIHLLIRNIVHRTWRLTRRAWSHCRPVLQRRTGWYTLNGKTGTCSIVLSQIYKNYIGPALACVLFVLQVEVGRTTTFRSISGGPRSHFAPELRCCFDHLLSGSMEARDPHVPLSLGWDGAYSTGRVYVAGPSVGRWAHRPIGGNRGLDAQHGCTFPGCSCRRWAYDFWGSRASPGMATRVPGP